MRLTICCERVYADAGVFPSIEGLAWAWTCHCTPVCAPGTAEEPAPASATVGSSGASVRANVASGRIAALDGGCAGAGPSCGFSG